MQRTLTQLLFILASFIGFPVLADIPPYNLPYGVTPVSQRIFDLHMAVFYICCGIGVLVFGGLFYCLWAFRQSKGAVPDKKLYEHLGVEILWTIIPFIILVVMAVPATKLLMYMHDTGNPALDIKITGAQWFWHYDYLNQGIGFDSRLSTPQAQIEGRQKKDQWFMLEVDNMLVVPVKAKIRLLLTSKDVIHSWWMPDFGIKQDAIPGYINSNWIYIEKPGIYRGQCAELCGAYHGFMPIVVEALPQDQFNAWVKQWRATHPQPKRVM